MAENRSDPLCESVPHSYVPRHSDFDVNSSLALPYGLDQKNLGTLEAN